MPGIRKVEYHYLCGENGTCPCLTKIEFLSLFGGDLTLSGCQKRRMSDSVLMDEIRKERISRSVWGTWGVSASLKT